MSVALGSRLTEHSAIRFPSRPLGKPMYRTLCWAVILAGVGLPARAQQPRLFYDYLENGKLTGGRFVMDPEDPEQRMMFGLDGQAAQAQIGWPVTTIINNGPSENRIDIVILGDGYTVGELSAYATHTQNVVTAFFAQEPLAAYAPYFNVHRVDVSSAQSGVDEIDLGIFRNTALDMAYGCFGIDRLLCINVSKAANAASSAPAVDQTLALANSSRYGGAGYPDNDIGTLAGINGSSVEIALHEFGHSFAELADEYDYGDGATYSGPEPIEANISTYVEATMQSLQAKWFRWLDLAVVGTFQGAYYNQFGVYRPTVNSKMRSLDRPFQEVNVEQFVFHMYNVVSPIDDATPDSVDTWPCRQFFVTPLQPVDHALDVQWSIDGADVPGATGWTFQADVESLAAGPHQVGVTVVDNTSRVRDESLRALTMTDTRQWTIEVQGIPDECLCLAPEPPLPETGGVEKSRYLSFEVPDPVTSGGALQAIRVRFTQLTGFESFNDEVRWVGPPSAFPESANPPTTFKGASLQCEPYFADWTGTGLLHVFSAGIVPSSDFAVQMVSDCCPALTEEACYSEVLVGSTGQWGDVVLPFGGGSQPNFTDVSAIVDKFRGVATAVITARADLAPNVPDTVANFTDISIDVDAFRGFAYPFGGPQPCP